MGVDLELRVGSSLVPEPRAPFLIGSVARVWATVRDTQTQVLAAAPSISFTVWNPQSAAVVYSGSQVGSIIPGIYWIDVPVNVAGGWSVVCYTHTTPNVIGSVSFDAEASDPESPVGVSVPWVDRRSGLVVFSDNQPVEATSLDDLPVIDEPTGSEKVVIVTPDGAGTTLLTTLVQIAVEAGARQAGADAAEERVDEILTPILSQAVQARDEANEAAEDASQHSQEAQEASFIASGLIETMVTARDQTLAAKQTSLDIAATLAAGGANYALLFETYAAMNAAVTVNLTRGNLLFDDGVYKRGVYLRWNGTLSRESDLPIDLQQKIEALRTAIDPQDVPGVSLIEAFPDGDIPMAIDPDDGVMKMLGLRARDAEVNIDGIAQILSFADGDVPMKFDPYDWALRPFGVSVDPRFLLDGVLYNVAYDDAQLPIQVDPETGLVSVLGVQPRKLIQSLAGSGGGSGVSYGDFTAAEVSILQQRAEKASDLIRRRIVPLAQPDADINLVIPFGESLSDGTEGWPVNTVSAQAPGLRMLGPSVHPMVLNGATWSVMNGDATIQELRATVTATFTGGGILTDEEIAALPFNQTNRGQTPGETAAAIFQLARLARGQSADRWIGVSSCGVGGTSVHQWQPGNASNLINRIRTCLQAWKAAADALGKTVKVIAFHWNQGANPPRDDYENRMITVMNGVRAIAAEVLPAQGSGVIPIYVGQTGGTYTTTSDNMIQSVSHIAVSEKLDGIFVVANNGAFFDKGQHFTGQGSAWLGCFIGKAMVETILNGRGWQCTQPISWHTKGTTLMGVIHAPVPPCTWGAPIVGYTAASRPDSGGVYLADAAGEITLSGAKFVERQVLMVTQSRPVGADPVAWVGRRNGTDAAPIFISDSDPAISAPSITYRYQAGSGAAAGENNPDFVGMPFPLNNLSLAQRQPVTIGL